MQQHRPLIGPWWLIAPVTLFALLLFVMLACHECLAFAMAVVCERSNNAMDVQMESNRAHGYIKERSSLGVFCWHEVNTGGNYSFSRKG